MKLNRLKGAVHSAAHHAMSYFSYLHPELGQLCESAQTASVSIDLLSGILTPVLPSASQRLRNAVGALGVRFRDIVAAEGVDGHVLTRATAVFQFSHKEWPDACLFSVSTQSGESFEAAVGFDGRSAEVLRFVTQPGVQADRP